MVKITVQVQNFIESLRILYLLYHWSLCNQTRCADLLLVITKPSTRKWAYIDSSTLTYSITRHRTGGYFAAQGDKVLFFFFFFFSFFFFFGGGRGGLLDEWSFTKTHCTLSLPPQYTWYSIRASITLRLMHHGTLNPSQCTESIMVHWIHHSTLNSSWYTQFIMVHSIHHGALNSFWFTQSIAIHNPSRYTQSITTSNPSRYTQYITVHLIHHGTVSPPEYRLERTKVNQTRTFFLIVCCAAR